MFPVQIDVLKSSREFDDLFQLEQTPGSAKASSRTWKVARPHFFKGCNQIELFPLAVNLYLKVCDEVEISLLLERKNYLRIHMYYQDNDCRTSCISVSNLDIDGLKDPKYRELLLSCPESRVPVEINLGPLWHYLGLDQTMLRNRRVELGFSSSTSGPKPLVLTQIGLELIGRDAYPSEDSEELIQEAEEVDQIFILRK